MITEPAMIAYHLRRAYRAVLSAGGISPSLPLTELFPFAESDVAGIHIHKLGAGDGLWFRLKDGRVFDGNGDIAEGTEGLYDTVEAAP